MRFFAAFITLTVLISSSAWADPIEGKWRTSRDDNGYFGLIEIQRCGDAFCGKLLRSYNDKNEVFESEYDGKMLITETVRMDDGSYRGRAFSPDRGKTYNSRIRVSGDQLQIKGCVLGICRTGGVWRRLNQ